MKLLIVCLWLEFSIAFPTQNSNDHGEYDGERSRKIIGQSVVTSVSVIMNGDGEAPHFIDSVGKTILRPFVPSVASPINLLNPDRYEFYTFNDNGELVKRLMTLKEIQSIVANGNGAVVGESESEAEPQSVLLNTISIPNQGSETRVQDIVDNVQNVLSREMENNRNNSHISSQLIDTPDVSSSWSLILPAIFGNTGDEILPHKPINMTPETEVFETTSARVETDKTSKKAPTTTEKSVVKTTKSSNKNTTKSTQPLSTKMSTKVKKPTIKPISSVKTVTTVKSTEATQMETKKTTIKPTTTAKTTPVKKIAKKPTAPSRRNYTVPFRPHLTNSPIIIEYIERKPSHGSKTETIKLQSKTERVTLTSLITPVVKVESTTKTLPKSTSPKTTEASTTSQTTNQPSTTDMRIVTVDQTTDHPTSLPLDEDRRQDSAISQIIGSLTSEFLNKYETSTFVEVESTQKDFAMEKIGDLNLIPDKVLLNDQLLIDEKEPIVKNVPTTTQTPDEAQKPVSEKHKMTITEKADGMDPAQNSEVMETIEKLLLEQASEKKKQSLDSLDILGFDDDGEETSFLLKETLKKSNISQSEFVTKTATIASAILSTTLIEAKTTEPSEEDDSYTTVPTILSEALSNVIKLMMQEQEMKATTVATEPSEGDLNKLLHHYEHLNIQQNHLATEPLLKDKNVDAANKVTANTAGSYSDMALVKETSTVPLKSKDDSKSSTIESISATRKPSEADFTTFFTIENDENEMTTTTPDLGRFTTMQSVVTEKRSSDRKEEINTTPLTVESEEAGEEETIDLMSDVLNAIGIASDEEDLTSTEKLKNVDESQESDEVESVISSLSSTIDKTLLTDVKTDLSLTSKIASSLISVANTISDTLNVNGESEESTESTTPAVSNPLESTEPITTLAEQILTIGPQPKDSTTEEIKKAVKINENSLENSKVSNASNKPPSPMIQLSVIRKDNSLEKIDFITPRIPTSTKIPITEGNFIKIENFIEALSGSKLTGLKNKKEEEKPVFVVLQNTTEITKLLSSEPMTERVPLIEPTKQPVQKTNLSSTEENLVEIKVQTKAPYAVTRISEDQYIPTLSNVQAIKENIKNFQHQERPKPPSIKLSAAPKEALGLGASTASLSTDLSDFSKLCNKLAFSFWKSITADGISQARSVIVSPFALTSMLSMIFLGARGQTSAEMNDLLQLDDMVTFNPHVVFRNISESVEQSRKSGIAAAAFVRELYSDRAKGKLMPYFKEKAQQFYNAHVEEVNFNVVNDILRRRTNLLVKRHTFTKITEHLKTNNIWVNEPLAAVSANVFLTDCAGTSMDERDGEMFFQVSPAIRQRRLIPIPAAVYRSRFTAGYDPILDATAVAFGDELQSTIMLMPGQQGSYVPGDNLERLENVLVNLSNNAWERLLTTFMERPGLEVQIPRFSHRSLINTTYALKEMGLKDIFNSEKSDLRGMTGAKSNGLFFSDLIQINQFTTCGEDKIADSHHVEIYPSPALKRIDSKNEEEEEDYEEKVGVSADSNIKQKSLFYDPIYDSRYINIPLPLRPRQARLPENPRLRFDRPFLYFVRHNPTGIILFMGRFNPRLLP